MLSISYQVIHNHHYTNTITLSSLQKQINLTQPIIIMIKKLKQSRFLQKLHRVVFQQSHLASYRPILVQSLHQKIFRLINDPSMPNDIPQDRPHIKYTLIQKIIFNQLPILHPCCNALLIWYSFLFTSIIYLFVQVGLMLTYGLDAWQSQLSSPLALTFDAFFLLVLLLDIFVQLNTGYLHRGMIIIDRQRIIGHYLHSYFIFDILTIFLYFLALCTTAYYLNIPKLLIIIKLGRIKQIDSYYQRRLNIHRILKTLYIIYKQIVIIFILSHIVGLFFYAMDLAISLTDWYDPQTQCWLYTSTAYSPIIAYSWQIQYLYTLYWGVNTITTISYGDIAAMNPIQVVYATLMFCFGFIVYGYVVNQIIKVILWAREIKDSYRAELILMDTYMANMHISKKTKQQVRQYLQFLHLQQKNRNLQLQFDMKAKLPDDLRFELVKSAYSILNDKLEDIFSSDACGRLLFALNQTKYTGNQLIISYDTPISTILYLLIGQLRFDCPHGTTTTTIYQTNTINQFLALQNYFKCQPSRYNIYSQRSSTIYTIPYQSILQQCAKNNQLLQKYRMAEYCVHYKDDIDRIFVRCYFCVGKHSWYACPQHLPQFNVVMKNVLVQTQMNRVQFRTTPALKCWKGFKQLQQRNNIIAQDELTKIEKRLSMIKSKLIEQGKHFQVDSCYEWKYYLPQENFSTYKQLWNTRTNIHKRQNNEQMLNGFINNLMQKKYQ